MTQDMFPRHWLNNSLLDEGFITQKAQELMQNQAQKPLAFDLGAWLDQHFHPQNLAAGNEAQLEDGFIRPLLAQLGWVAVTQQSFVVQGKLAKPDWCLLQDHGQNNALIASQDHRLITAICESKAWDKALDNGKANKDNPHHQLQDYLSTLRVRFGFLTNGQIGRAHV